jgi:hypothetical protein
MNMNLPPQGPPAQPYFEVVSEYVDTPDYFASMPKSSGHEYKGIPISDEQWSIFQAKVAEIISQDTKIMGEVAGVPYTAKDAKELEDALRQITEAERAALQDAATIFIGENAVDEEGGATDAPIELFVSDFLVNAVVGQLRLRKTVPPKRDYVTLADVLGPEEMSRYETELREREQANKARRKAWESRQR